MTHRLSDRLAKLPPYPFVELDRMKREALEKGVDIINLGIGDPDQPTPQRIIDALAGAANDPANHQYPLGTGLADFRREVAHYYLRYHRVTLDPASEVGALIGSKEGIAHFPLAFVNPGDVVLYPDPGYPVYQSSAIFAGAEPVAMPLLAENGFLPDLDAIPPDTLRRTRLMFLNYPNNPTAALAGMEFFGKVVALARKYGFIVLHDAAYLDIAFFGEKPLSFLAVPGAREVGLELHSLSKTFNMTGWRIGFVAGNPELVAGLMAIKANVDSGVFNVVQRAGIEALRSIDVLLPTIISVYDERLKALDEGIRSLGWTDFTSPRSTFYVWVRNRGRRSSFEMTKALLEECGIVTTPGTAFGSYGEGFFRIALTTGAARIREAVERIRKAGL